MAKACVELSVLDVDKVTAIKDLFNEILDENQNLKLMLECGYRNVIEERTKYVNRFVEIITNGI